ncbi:hypothetical protein HDV06_005760 [Boothiomyces sp. JEL0866]|nr:hypothetical protein HDV06_005760 [Boothiomyces sp. JEL0866]
MLWGFSTSAYQIEGAWNIDGKGPSVWDHWYQDPIRINNPNANIAADHYHKMREDVSILSSLGATAYRFSISWPRLLPDCTGKVNENGIQFYSDLLDELSKHNITPVLTMFHWDTPQACHDKYHSWNDYQIVQDFTFYADVIFHYFSDRVQYYLTLNEPAAECGYGFGMDKWAPGFNGGEEAKYKCIHLSNLVHGSVVKLAKSKYRKDLYFGMPLPITFGVPMTDSELDIQAADKFMFHQSDLHWGPLVNGDYSQTTRKDTYFGKYLLHFNESERMLVKDTLDFVAINYYTSAYVYHDSNGQYGSTTTKNGVLIGPVPQSSWQNIYYPGIRGMSNWVYKTYNMTVMISECGVAVPGEQTLPLSKLIRDEYRVEFYTGILKSLSEAVLIDKTPISMFLAWSLLDNFEWGTFDERFGVVYFDHSTLKRYIKDSALYLRDAFTLFPKSLLNWHRYSILEYMDMWDFPVDEPFNKS